MRDACEEIAQPVIDWLLADIAERVEEAGKMTSTAAYEIYRAQALDESKKALQDYLKKQLKLSQKEVRQLMHKAAKFSSEDDYQRVGIWASEAEQKSLMQITDAAVKLAGDELQNITQTMGMVSPITGTPQPLQKVYQDCMDTAVKLVANGGTSASQAAREATRKLAERGVVSIDYASGVSTELGAAVRRNLMGGMGLMVEQITQQNHDILGCDGWEISAHANSAPDHEDIQGRQYSDKEFEQLNSSLKRRIGTLNCGHVAMPIILGVNSPQYTEAELQALKDENAKGVTYEGRQMTGYEATQYQNRIERTIRKQKRRILLSEKTGDKEQLLADQVRLTRLNQEYRKFNTAMGFKSRQERLEVIGWGRKQAAQASGAARKEFNDLVEIAKNGGKIRLSENMEDVFAKKSFQELEPFKEKLSDRVVRKWYKAHDNEIPQMLDQTKTVEEQARQACNLRNLHRTQARDLMEDQKKRRELDKTDPNKEFEELIADKMTRKALSREEAIQDILKTATKTRKSVDTSLGLR